jgi:hypothetical protein
MSDCRAPVTSAEVHPGEVVVELTVVKPRTVSTFQDARLPQNESDIGRRVARVDPIADERSDDVGGRPLAS